MLIERKPPQPLKLYGIQHPYVINCERTRFKIDGCVGTLAADYASQAVTIGRLLKDSPQDVVEDEYKEV